MKILARLVFICFSGTPLTKPTEDTLTSVSTVGNVAVPKYTWSCLIYFHQYFFSENVLSFTKIPCEIEDLEIEIQLLVCWLWCEVDQKLDKNR
ncbi:hypothetical protein T03_7027 [Trichinella britovi]|uniref:Uncharacterized protein n=1 Tax=Trichinella britovi TaxID=45882 RepID=A0A0V1CFY1_TRIBR|nr:hypothetical protein T03_7027 [Trichinella britovi]